MDALTDPWAAFDPQPADSFTGVIPGVPKGPPPPHADAGYILNPDGSETPRPGGPADPTPANAPTKLPSDPATMDMVKALAEGRKSFPSGSALRAPYWQNMLAYVGMYDPGYDETTYLTRAATRKDFAVGKGGQNIRALNTAIGHLGTLYDQIPDTASHQFSVAGIPVPGATAANAVENAYMTSSGDPGPGKYASTVTALSGELTQVYRNAGGAEADIQRYINQLSPNQSEAQKKATIQNIVDLLHSRLNALQDQYVKNLGVGSRGYQFLDPQAEKTLSLIESGRDPNSPNSGIAGPHAGVPPLGPGDNGGGSGGGGDGHPGVSNLSPDQSKAYDAFLAANPKPSGDQVGAFLTQLTGKPVTNGDDIAKAIAQGRGVSTTVENGAIKAKADQMMREGGGGGAAAIAGAADTVSMGLSDEIGAGVNALGESLGGHGSFADNYSTDVGANRLYQQDLRGEHPVLYTGGQLAGGLLLPTGEVAGALDAAKLGAGYGAAYGVGSGDNGIGSRIYGGALGAVTGGAGGAAGHAAVSALAPYAAPVVNRLLPLARRDPLGMAPDVANAAQAEGVDLIRPMVDPASRGKFGALESAPGSQNVIRQGVDKVRGQIEQRVADLGAGGTPLETDAAGEKVQNAARQFIQRSKGVADRLYNRARSLAGDTRFVPQNAIDSIDQSVADLSANPKTNAGEINFLQGIKSDLSTPGGKTVEELRQLRQSLRGRINEQNLTSTGAEGRAIGAMDATHTDAAANLPAGAATAYRRADTFYRERMVHVDDILDRFLGGNVQQGQARLSGEQAFTRLKSMMAPGGDARRLAGLMRDLDPSERQDISATIASSLGRRAPDEPFSTDLLLSQTNKLSPQAQRTVFGPDGAESIANLRTLSQSLKAGVGDFNRSKTANSMWRQMASGVVASLTGLGGAGGMLEGGVSGGMAGAAGGALAGAAAKGVQTARNILSARAMVNPRVSRWLAQAANVSTPSQAQQAVKSLRLVISREPALAHELLPIHQFLDQRVTQLLAAQPGNNDQGN